MIETRSIRNEHIVGDLAGVGIEHDGALHGDAGHHHVFVSYARADKAFVAALTDALKERGRQAWVDWEGIRPTAAWMAEIYRAIEASDTFVLVISPTSVRSAVCGQEVAHALALNKRVVPLVRTEVDPQQVPEGVGSLNWIFFRAEDDFGAAVTTLVDAIDTDLSWVRDHTRLLLKAAEWDEGGHSKGLLLRGRELESAERWLAESAAKRPSASTLHTAYIIASRRASSARLRWTAFAAVLIVLVASGLAVTAWHERNQALVQRQAAEEQTRIARQQTALAEHRQQVSLSRELAVSSAAELSVDPEAGLVLAIKAVSAAPTEEARFALTQAVLASHERGVLAPTSGRGPVEADLSADGHLALVFPVIGHIQVWDVDSGRVVSTLAGSASSGSFSPDGREVLTTDRQGRTRLWKAKGGALIRQFTSHGALLSSFSRDGTRTVTVGDDHIARFWATRTGERLPPAPVRIFGPPGSLSVDARTWVDIGKSKVNVWNTATGNRLWTMLDSYRQLSTFAFSSDGRRLAWAGTSQNHVAHVDNARTGEEMATLRGATDVVDSLAFSTDGRLVAGGTESLDGSMRVWQSSTGARVAVMRGHTGDVSVVTFSPDGKRLLSGSTDHTARLWRISNGSSMAVFAGHAGAVVDAAFSSSGDRVITLGDDRTARIWDASEGLPSAVVVDTLPYLPYVFSPGDRLAVSAGGGSVAREILTRTGRPRRTLGGHDGPVRAVELSPDGRLALTSAGGRIVRIWNASTGQLISALSSESQISQALFAPDGSSVLTLSGGGPATLWNMDGSPRAVVRGPTDPVVRAGFSSDGAHVLATDRHGRVWLWQTASGSDAVPLLAGPGPLWLPSTFSPDGRLVLTVDPSGNARVWDASSGTRVSKPRGLVTKGSFSPDGKLVVTTPGPALRPDVARVWDSSTGRQRFALASRGQVLDAEFNADGTLIATASADHTIRLWSSSTGNLVDVLRGHTSAVFTASFDPSGRFLVSSADDSTVRVWDAASGRSLWSLTYDPRHQFVSFSPTGRYIVVSEGRGLASVYACDVCVSPQRLLSLARSHVTRPLTSEQRRTFLHR
jgi:WD40 repeat protein